jgi:hypothetical protein
VANDRPNRDRFIDGLIGAAVALAAFLLLCLSAHPELFGG